MPDFVVHAFAVFGAACLVFIIIAVCALSLLALLARAMSDRR